MKKILYILLFAACTMQAQGVMFALEDETYQQGQPVALHCETYGFSHIVSFQFGILFDTAVLRLDSMKVTVNLPDYNASQNFGYQAISQGTIIKPGEFRTVWTDPIGRTLEDGTRIFTVYFTAKQSGAFSQNIIPYPQGMPFEAIRYFYEFIPLDVVFIDETTAAQTPGSEPKIYPNPTSGPLVIEGDSREPVRIFDAAGRLEQQAITTPGATYLHLTGNAGIKFVQIGGRTVKIEKQ